MYIFNCRYLIEDLRDKYQGGRITFLCPQIISGDECKRDFFGAIAYLKHAFTSELQKKESHCKFILAPYKEEYELMTFISFNLYVHALYFILIFNLLCFI